MTSRVSKLTGRQEPHNVSLFDGEDVHGAKALKLLGRVTSEPFPWQEWFVTQSLLTDPLGSWVHSDVVLIVPRQNGKSWCIEGLIVYKLFVLHENIVFTSQRWKTSEEIYRRVFNIIKKRKSLSKKVRRNVCSQGQAEIFLDDGGKVLFATRSTDSGRGFTEIDTLIYDEAYNLSEAETAAWDFAQLAADDPQTFYLSSALDQDIHQYGEVLTGMRNAGLEKREGTLFAEWMAPKSFNRASEAAWQYANPSYGAIQTREKVEKLLRKANTPAGRKAFDVEVLGRGDWPVIDTGEKSWIIPIEDWNAKHNPSPEVVGDHAVAVDASPDGVTVGIVSASRARDGKYHLSLNPMREFDRVGVTDAVVRAVKKNDPVAVGLDPKGAAGVLTLELKEHEIDCELMNAIRVTASCELFFQLFKEGLIEHDGNSRWHEALSTAEFRKLNSGRALTKKTGDITTLVAATFAVWLLRQYELPDALPDSMQQKKKKSLPPPLVAVGVRQSSF